MPISLLWLVMSCLETIQGLSLVRGSRKNVKENRLIEEASRELTARGFKILATHQALDREDVANGRRVAEFDIIARDSEESLTLVEVKFRINLERKLRRQLSRYQSFLLQSPFVNAPVARVIVISRSVNPSLMEFWTSQGLEFIELAKQKVGH